MVPGQLQQWVATRLDPLPTAPLLAPDHPMSQLAQGVANDLWVHASRHRPEVPFRLSILDDDRPITAARPDGEILISRGTVLDLQNEAALSWVLGELTGRVVLLHDARRLRPALALEGLRSVGSRGSIAASRYQALLSAVLGLLAGAFDNRALIREAGAYGLQLTHQEADNVTGALELIEGTIRSGTASLGPAHPEVVTAQALRGALLMSQGRFEEALSPLTAVVRAQRSHHGGEENVPTGEAMIQLARAFHPLGRHDSARELQERALGILTRLSNDDDTVAILSVAGDLASTLSSMGQTKETLRRRRDLVVRHTAAVGADDPSTLAAKVNLATSLVATRKPQDAVDLLVEVVAAYGRIPGDHRSEALVAQNNLATALAHTGKNELALTLLREVADGHSELTGPFSVNALAAQVNVSSALFRTNRRDEALELLRASFEGSRDIHTLNHPITIQVLEVLIARLGDATPRAKARGFAAQATLFASCE